MRGSGFESPTSHEMITASNRASSGQRARTRAIISGPLFDRKAVRPPVRRNRAASAQTSSW